MSLTGQRKAIASALSSVAGVTGHETRPPAPAEGDAWPLLGPGDRQAGTAFMLTWVVRVFVPQDEVGAADWWDSHWPDLFWALHQQVGTVDRFAPAAVPAAGGDQLVYEITIRTEE